MTVMDGIGRNMVDLLKMLHKFRSYQMGRGYDRIENQSANQFSSSKRLEYKLYFFIP